MWGNYHQLHTSTTFKQKWKLFCKKLTVDYNTLFIQHITDNMFMELIKKEFPLPAGPEEESSGPEHYRKKSPSICGRLCLPKGQR